MPADSRQRLAIALITLLLLVVVLTLVFPPAKWIPARRWGESLEAAGAMGMCLFVLAGILATSVGLPRQLVAFIGGLAYGLMSGLALSLLAALCGCYLAVRFSKHFLSSWVTTRYPRFIAKLDALLQEDVFVKILVLRLQPLGTNLLTNVCIGFTRVSHKRFLAASAVGYIPQMLVFALLGTGVRVGSQAQLRLSIALLLVSIVLGLWLYRRHRVRSATSR